MKNSNYIEYISKLLLENVELSNEALYDQIQAQIVADNEQVEFIQKMYRDPLSIQADYLVDKKVQLILEKESKHAAK